MKTDLNINFLISHIASKASSDRKIGGGTYKTLFFFTGIDDYFQIYGRGLYQAVGRDNDHTYFKNWGNSSFTGVEPQDIFKQLGSYINRIEIYGCGNDYKKVFSSFKDFLQWIEVNPADADITFLEEPVEAIKEKEELTADKENKAEDKTTSNENDSDKKEEPKNKETDKDIKPSEDFKKPVVVLGDTDETEKTTPASSPLEKKPVVIIDNNIEQTDNKSSDITEAKETSKED